MLTRVTKKAINELATRIKNKGYWSKEVQEFLSQYEYGSMIRLNNAAKVLSRSM